MTSNAVQHPEWVMLSPSGRMLVVVDSTDTFTIVDVLMIGSVTFFSNGEGRHRPA